MSGVPVCEGAFVVPEGANAGFAPVLLTKRVEVCGALVPAGAAGPPVSAWDLHERRDLVVAQASPALVLHPRHLLLVFREQPVREHVEVEGDAAA